MTSKASAPGRASSSHFAVVLPGAVARGAYEAGVIGVLARNKMKVERIVATSSGALNGLAFAAGIRAGNEIQMADQLEKSWIQQGSWRGSFHINILGLLRGKGLSTQSGVLALMKNLIKPCVAEKKHPIEFYVIVTPLNGVEGRIARKPATTYEKVLKFKDADFDTQEGLDRIFTAVAAACAFPGLFEPVNIEGLGLCVDGGAVNNAPIGYALEGSTVNRVIMPVPFPALMPPTDWKKGFGLLNHLIEILINERLYRDLKLSQAVNADADVIERLQKKGSLSEEQAAELRRDLKIRKVEITEVRPQKVFTQSPFSGFFHQETRLKLIEAGREAAQTALEIIPAENPSGEQTT